MAFDRGIWLRGFGGKSPTPWPCAYCNGARLHLVEDSLYKQETSDSREARSHDAWEPHWIDGRFVCMLRCPDCGNPCAIAGTYTADEEYIKVEYGELESHLVETLKPQFFSDPPPIIRSPPRVPEKVTGELENSFHLYWISAEACANSIRSVVEHLLTHFSVARWSDPKRKRGRIALHDRIEKYRSKNPDIADQLMAVKWIGNAGSHAKPIHLDDLLDGYELLEDVLDQLFGGRQKRIARLSRQINKRRGPRLPRPRRAKKSRTLNRA